MYNSLNFFNNSMVWITQAEADSMSTDFLAGKPFVSLPRLQKTYNSSSVHDVGPNNVFSDPTVAGGEFKFAYNGLWAKLADKEYVWNKGWKLQRGSWDGNGMSFDDYIASTILQ
jgi:hypothetical protein